MNIEEIRTYALSLPEATEDCVFGEEYVNFRVRNKIFACLMLERAEVLVLKCDPEYAIALRDRFAAIQPAWHWNKRYWNQHDITAPELSDALLRHLISHAYNCVVLKLTRPQRQGLHVLPEGCAPQSIHA